MKKSLRENRNKIGIKVMRIKGKISKVKVEK